MAIADEMMEIFVLAAASAWAGEAVEDRVTAERILTVECHLNPDDLQAALGAVAGVVRDRLLSDEALGAFWENRRERLQGQRAEGNPQADRWRPPFDPLREDVAAALDAIGLKGVV